VKKLKFNETIGSPLPNAGEALGVRGTSSLQVHWTFQSSLGATGKVRSKGETSMSGLNMDILPMIPGGYTAAKGVFYSG
jgi:hypothetical protein